MCMPRNLLWLLECILYYCIFKCMHVCVQEMAILVFLIVSFAVVSCSREDATNSIQLFVMLPLNPSLTESATVARWERGLEILPAAHIAVERINQDPSILPGYQLELVEIDSGPCTDNVLDALLNFYEKLITDENSALGVLGLFCTPLTQLISPLAGQEEIGLVQISASPSPFLRDKLQDYPLLHFAVPSAVAYYSTMLRMMHEFEWRRVYIIAGTPGTHYFHTAESFYKYTFSNTNFTANFSYYNPLTLVDLRHSGFRIVFASVDAQQAATLICQAHKEGLTSPLFAWVFYEHSLEDLLAFANQTCDVQTMISALNGSFFLQFPLAQSDPQVTIVSGQTYQEYYNEYLDKLNSNPTTQLQPNLYANVMYDQVWAFALALNKSVNICDNNLSHLDRSKFRNVINRNMLNTSFVSASKNYDIHSAFVNISRFNFNTVNHIGFYNKTVDDVTFKLNIGEESIPNDEMLRRYVLQALPFTSIICTIIGACLIFTTTVFIMFVYYRNEPEIKATSPQLSMLMFLGCYLLFVSILVHTGTAAVITRGFLRVGGCSTTVSTATVGINLIFATLFARMLRIYRIFSSVRRMGKAWRSRYLLVIVVLIVGVDISILITWAIVDVFRTEDMITFQKASGDQQLPYLQIREICTSKYLTVWIAVIFLKLGILITAVFILAIKTRNVPLENFKDTKKVNGYIFLMVTVISILVPLWFVLNTISNATGSSITINMGYGLTALLCQLILFLPKVSPPFLRHMKQRLARHTKHFQLSAQTRTKVALQSRLPCTLACS